jgi:hypothetical protein
MNRARRLGALAERSFRLVFTSTTVSAGSPSRSVATPSGRNAASTSSASTGRVPQADLDLDDDHLVRHPGRGRAGRPGRLADRHVDDADEIAFETGAVVPGD